MEKNPEEIEKEPVKAEIGSLSSPAFNRESPEDDEPRRPPGTFPIASVTLFYVALACVGLLWRWLAGHRPLFPFAGFETVEALAVGCISGIAIAVASAVASRIFTWARELENLFSGLLGPLGPAGAFFLALASSVAEETFFRAAMQASIGLLPASAVFAIAHFPLERKLIPWTIEALVMGLLLGWMFEHYHGLAGPIACHFIINLVGLIRLGRKFSA